MILSRVIYELYAVDQDALDLAEQGKTHEIDREIHLAFENGDQSYISWSWVPADHQPTMYVIAHKPETWFNAAPQLVRDVSETPIWRSLIGSEISLQFRGEDQQVLEINSDRSSVFCYTDDLDTVTISSEPPSASQPNAPATH